MRTKNPIQIRVQLLKLAKITLQPDVRWMFGRPASASARYHSGRKQTATTTASVCLIKIPLWARRWHTIVCVQQPQPGRRGRWQLLELQWPRGRQGCPVPSLSSVSGIPLCRLLSNIHHSPSRSIHLDPPGRINYYAIWTTGSRRRQAPSWSRL